jgi:formylglycine-generating enzyme required for sulfatase activity
VLAVAASADGTLAATAGADGQVRLWTAPDFKRRGRIAAFAGAALSVAVAPDGSAVFAGGVEGRLRAFDAAGGRLLADIPSGGGAVRGLSVSADGALLAAALDDGTVAVWETAALTKPPAGAKAPAEPEIAGPVGPAGLPPPTKAPFDAAAARKAQEAWAAAVGRAPVEDGPLGIRLAVIPPGEFGMGAARPEDGDARWGPAHRVRLTKPFLMGVREITVREFRLFAEATGYKTVAERSGGVQYWNDSLSRNDRKPEWNWRTPGYDQTDDFPVTCLAHSDAAAFCEWLSRGTGLRVRLPTEAEWEYACRAGTATAFHFGDTPSPDRARMNIGGPPAGPVPVGSLPPNAFGLHEMHGNADERCADGPRQYTRDPVTDPVGTALETCVRGGGWTSWNCHSAARNYNPADFDFRDTGFRIVIDAPAPASPPPPGRAVGSTAPAPAPAPVPLAAPFDAAAAKAARGAWAARLGRPAEETNSVGMRLVLVPPGRFRMGLPGGDPHEGPVHDVLIARPVYFGAFEVTQSEWAAVMGTNPASFSAGGGDADKVRGTDTSRFPVENITWPEAMEFCRKLSTRPQERAAGRSYRLPTEAEWEYACRAGTATAFHFGDAASDAAMNAELRLGRPEAVGSHPVNAFGLFDMHGNVAELCGEGRRDYSLPARRTAGGAAVDPIGPAEPAGGRAVRGGSWGYNDEGCRAGVRRGELLPIQRDRGVGLRVVCEVAAPGGPSPARLLGRHLAAARQVALSPDGRICVSVGDDWAVAIDIAADKPLYFQKPGPVAVAISPEGDLLATAGLDGTARVWNLADGKPAAEPVGKHAGPCTAVAFVPGGKALLSGGEDGEILYRVVRAGADPGKAPKRPGKPVRALAAVRGNKHYAAVLGPPGGELSFTVDGKPGQPCGCPNAAVAAASEPGLIAATTSCTSAALFDAETGKPVRQLEVDAMIVRAFAFSADGRRLLGGGVDGVRVWDVATGKAVADLPASSHAWGVSLSADGRTAAAACHDGCVKIWDLSALPEPPPVK